MSNYTTRFSSRVPYYHASRPRYPHAMIDLLAREVGLNPTSIIADIGAGTGISSELFLKNGNTVYAIEPNADMLNIAREHYSVYPNFRPIHAPAEATTLPDHSVDLVVAGQAFHWFNHEQAKIEFKRILKPEAYVVLFWNLHHNDLSPFTIAYNQLVETYDTEKAFTPRARQNSAEIQQDLFFGVNHYQKGVLPNEQKLDFEGLHSRLLSSSYIPLPDHPDYPAMIEQLKVIFDLYQVDGQVLMNYTTEVYWGKLA